MTLVRTSVLASLSLLLLAAALPRYVRTDEPAANQLQPATAAGCSAAANGGACCASCQENAAKLAAAGEKADVNAPPHECPCQRARRLKEQAAKQQSGQ